MNVAEYYEEIRRVEASLQSDYVWITSNATRNGGVAGRTVEAPRRVAATMLAAGSARLATADERQRELDTAARAAKRNDANVRSEFTVANISKKAVSE